MQSHSGTMTNLAALSRLIRLPLSVMVAISALTGALAADQQVSGFNLWALAWGIFLLSSSCSVLNQVQERSTDHQVAHHSGHVCGHIIIIIMKIYGAPHLPP